MPVTVKILTPLKLVVVDCSGVVTDNDWLDTFSRLWANPSFDRSSDKLIDTRRVERFEVKSATIFRLGAEARKVYEGQPKSKTAVVAPLPEIHGVARQHQLITEGIAPETQVFWTYEEACAWLGRNPENPPPPAAGDLRK